MKKLLLLILLCTSIAQANTTASLMMAKSPGRQPVYDADFVADMTSNTLDIDGELVLTGVEKADDTVTTPSGGGGGGSSTLQDVTNNGNTTTQPITAKQYLFTTTSSAVIAATTGAARGASAVDLQANRDNSSQVASGEASVISGGEANTASGDYSGISGGADNSAIADESWVGGGRSNYVSAFGSSIDGGSNNSVVGDIEAWSGIVNGYQNNITNSYGSIIGAGAINVIEALTGGPAPSYCIIGSGGGNTINSAFGGILTASNCTITSTSLFGTIINGQSNVVSGHFATALGFQNVASGEHSTAIGEDCISSATHAVAIGKGIIASRANSFWLGTYNVDNPLVLFGIGSGGSSGSRSNFLTLDNNGNIVTAGDIAPQTLTAASQITENSKRVLVPSRLYAGSNITIATNDAAGSATISATGGSEVDTLQSVTDRGNSTTNDMLVADGKVTFEHTGSSGLVTIHGNGSGTWGIDFVDDGGPDSHTIVWNADNSRFEASHSVYSAGALTVTGAVNADGGSITFGGTSDSLYYDGNINSSVPFRCDDYIQPTGGYHSSMGNAGTTTDVSFTAAEGVFTLHIEDGLIVQVDTP